MNRIQNDRNQGGIHQKMRYREVEPKRPLQLITKKNVVVNIDRDDDNRSSLRKEKVSNQGNRENYDV